MIPHGAYILEELAARGKNLDDLLDHLQTNSGGRFGRWSPFPGWFYRVLDGREPITAEMASSLSEFFGTSEALWLNLQRAAEARKGRA